MKWTETVALENTVPMNIDLNFYFSLFVKNCCTSLGNTNSVLIKDKFHYTSWLMRPYSQISICCLNAAAAWKKNLLILKEVPQPQCSYRCLKILQSAFSCSKRSLITKSTQRVYEIWGLPMMEWTIIPENTALFIWESRDYFNYSGPTVHCISVNTLKNIF